MTVYKKLYLKCSLFCILLFFFSSRRRHTRCGRDWSSDVCSSDLGGGKADLAALNQHTESQAKQRTQAEQLLPGREQVHHKAQINEGNSTTHIRLDNPGFGNGRFTRTPRQRRLALPPAHLR